MAAKARIAVIGLGYAGLPMAIEFARAGFLTVGFDVDARKIEYIRRGCSPDHEPAVYGPLAGADLGQVCVKAVTLPGRGACPTPLSQ